MRQRWTLSGEAFDGLLAAFSPDREEAARRYEKVRERLIRYFSWERCESPEDCADETLNRVAKRVSEGEALANPEGYCFAAARLIAREATLAVQRRARAVEELSHRHAPEPSDTDDAVWQRLEHCLGQLSADQRAFLLEYYQGEQRSRIEIRQRIALRLGLPLNAVRNRALRLREKLENCVSVIFSAASSPQDGRTNG